MASTAILAVRIISDASSASRSLQGYESRVSKVQSAMAKVTPAAKGTILAIAAVGAAAFKQASDLQQSSGAVESVFKRQAGAVKSLARSAANDVGLARSEYQDLAAVLGSQLGNLGIAQKKLVPTTDRLIKTGADLAATYGGTTKEAVEALSAAMRGETDPIERYGISIKQATVDTYLHKKGLDNLKGAAEQQARTQATLALITQQSAAAHGAFAREANTAAGQQQRAYANLKNAGAALGMVLLPVVASIAQRLATMAQWVMKNKDTVLLLTGVIGGLAVGVLAVNAALSAYVAISRVIKAVTVAWKIAQFALNVALAANPVGLVVVAIVALVAAVVIAYKKSETFRRIVQAVMHAAAAAVGWLIDKIGALIGWIKSKAPAAWRVMKAVAMAVWNALTAQPRLLIRVIGVVITWLRSRLGGAFTWVKERALDVWGRIVDGGRRIGDWIANAVGWLRDRLGGAFTAAKEKALAAWSRVVEGGRRISDWVSSAVGWVKDRLGGAFTSFKDKAVNAVNAVIDPIRNAIDWVRDLIDAIGNIHIPSLGGLASKIGGAFGSAHSPSLTAGGLTAAGGGGPVFGGGGVSITVTGALDADGVARQIEQLLARRARRLGRPVGAGGTAAYAL